jgi:hypothetical protein
MSCHQMGIGDGGVIEIGRAEAVRHVPRPRNTAAGRGCAEAERPAVP